MPKRLQDHNGHEPRKQVGIWIRVSTEDQARGDSPEHHERRASYYAESKDWDIKTVYHLEAVSGKSVMDHPEAKRMLEDVRKGRITGLIFSKLARLARNTKELLEFADIFKEYDADLISLQESIDTSSPAGRLLYTMISALAQWERDEISDRVAASIPIRAKLGKSTGGAAPFGYQWKDKKLIPHPDEAPVRKRMYELFLECRRKKTVARLLNEAGHRTRTGARFSDTTIDRLIKDPVAKGLHRANYTKSEGKGCQWHYKPEKDWVFTDVEPIVSSQMWEQCNAILETQRASRRRIGKRPVQLFGGLTYCVCETKMYVLSNSPKYTCHKCRNKIAINDLEDVYLAQLKDFFMSPTEIGKYLKDADETVREKAALIETLQREYQKLKAEMDEVYNLYMVKQITAEGFGKRYLPMEERERQLDEEIPRLQAELDLLKVTFLSSEQIMEDGSNLYKRWPELEFGAKREIVESITEKIVIGKDDVEINLFYIPTTHPSPKNLATRQHNFRGSWPLPA